MTIEQTSEKKKGRATFRIDAGLYEDLGQPVTAKEWLTALLLPDAYEIEKIEYVGTVYEVTVLSQLIKITVSSCLLDNM